MKLKIILVTVALLVPQLIGAQGTTYVSNLDQPFNGSQAVGKDSWLALRFMTGDNPGGYLLNSVQLGMTEAVGSLNGFLAMIYNKDPNTFGGTYPGTSLGSLNSSFDPASGGVLTFTSDANLSLLPLISYFIELTAGSSVSTGAYNLNLASAYDSMDQWHGTGTLLYSADGKTWTGTTSFFPQYAINATAVPEPNTLALFALSGLPWAWRRFCRGC